MSRALMLRDIRPGAAVVADRASGWPLATIERHRARYTFPGHGSTTATVWEVRVAGRPICRDTTRRGALTLARSALERRGLMRSDDAGDHDGGERLDLAGSAVLPDGDRPVGDPPHRTMDGPGDLGPEGEMRA